MRPSCDTGRNRSRSGRAICRINPEPSPDMTGTPSSRTHTSPWPAPPPRNPVASCQLTWRRFPQSINEPAHQPIACPPSHHITPPAQSTKARLPHPPHHIVGDIFEVEVAAAMHGPETSCDQATTRSPPPAERPSPPAGSKDGQSGSRRVLFTTDRTGAPLDSYGGSPRAVVEGRQSVGSSGSAPPGPSGASMAEVQMASGKGRHPSPESACASAAIKAAEVPTLSRTRHLAHEPPIAIAVHWCF